MGDIVCKTKLIIRICNNIQFKDMNKTALITGAIKGIGFEVSKQLGELEVILIVTQTMIGKISSNKFSRH